MGRVKILTILFSLVLMGCATDASRRDVVEYPEQHKDLIPIDIWIVTGKAPLGAYAITLHFDPHLVEIASIKTGDERTFPRVPDCDRRGLRRGQLMLGSYIIRQPDKDLSETNDYHVATVYFKPLLKGSLKLHVVLNRLMDPSANPIEGGVRLSQYVVEIEGS